MLGLPNQSKSPHAVPNHPFPSHTSPNPNRSLSSLDRLEPFHLVLSRPVPNTGHFTPHLSVPIPNQKPRYISPARPIPRQSSPNLATTCQFNPKRTKPFQSARNQTNRPTPNQSTSVLARSSQSIPHQATSSQTNSKPILKEVINHERS